MVQWIEETWNAEVGQPAAERADPVDALTAMARGHAVYCRRDTARVMLTLRVEFAGQDHPIGRALEDVIDRLIADWADRIAAGRASGAIPAGPPPRETADALLSAIEAVGISLAGQAPFDVELTERAVRGVLGLPPIPFPSDLRSDAEVETHE